jgi:glutathione synthase/RimK-type ligase-like ATP-grasp enzyme
MKRLVAVHPTFFYKNKIMKQYDVVILTEKSFVNPPEVTPYIKNVLWEDQLVQEALERKGLSVIRIAWEDTDFDWATTRIALVRSIWNYATQVESFIKWFKEVQQKTQIVNVPEIIEWNIDKHYLKDLSDKGIHIPTTIFAHKGDYISLKAFFEKGDWSEAVIKPTVSAGAKHTYRINAENISEHEAIFKEVIAQEDMIIQPFLKSVMERGEVSLMVMNGKYTHAVLKIAKPGDFRVQDNWGGTVHHYNPTPEEMAFAEQAVAACSPTPQYARIDIAYDNDEQIVLIELELFEPELWFRFKPEAADELAESMFEFLL